MNRSRLIPLLSLLTLMMATIAPASAADKVNPFTPLWNQEYALCAGAVTFNFDGITYAKCRKLLGDSLGLTHAYPPNNNVQTVNNMGIASGTYIVSTYSPPSPQEYALYDCKAQGAFAQCNGGICFSNTSGSAFPGVGPVADNEIICSCPITTTANYHVTGPADCPDTRAEYDRICGKGSKKAKTADGVSLYIGAGGAPSATLAMNAVYDETFGTTSQAKICKRPKR